MKKGGKWNTKVVIRLRKDSLNKLGDFSCRTVIHRLFSTLELALKGY